MRRLAKNSRKDKVLSARDYQQKHEREGVGFKLPRGGGRLVFCGKIEAPDGPDYVAAGGYLKADRAGRLTIRLRSQGQETTGVLNASRSWERFGLVLPRTGTAEVTLVVEVPPEIKQVDLWGIDAGVPEFPEVLAKSGGLSIDALSSAHLTPETLYIPHRSALALEPVPSEWRGGPSQPMPGSKIIVKKCAYCQRFLPLDPRRPGALAFHKHNAKVSGHQNECRACKKWRINDAFNPDRTVDQLHESSVITRERKIFLREPEILQAIKDREGAGLKSIIWERFDRKCFRCQREIPLEEVELDHTRPLAYLWPIDKHATCLCGECNNYKKDRFPVDVYNEDQLRRLSNITGLPYAELITKEVNRAELGRFVADIGRFAREWDPKTFNATARKIRELLPEVNLFELLRAADRAAYRYVMKSLQERPGD